MNDRHFYCLFSQTYLSWIEAYYLQTICNYYIHLDFPGKDHKTLWEISSEIVNNQGVVMNDVKESQLRESEKRFR
jgi:hypothetical protein